MKTLDGLYVLQWSLLKKICSEQTHLTTDPVLDSWFSILFAFAAFHPTLPCQSAILSTVVSHIPESNQLAISEIIIPSALNSLYCFNYWHLLEFLYFPLNFHNEHWILIRVGIESQMIEVFDSLGNPLGLSLQKVSYHPCTHFG